LDKRGVACFKSDVGIDISYLKDMPNKYKMDLLLFSLEKIKIPVALLRFVNVFLTVMMMIVIKAVQILRM
jgi:hypothetical protein